MDMQEDDLNFDFEITAVFDREEWWLTCFNRQLVWARLRVSESGVAYVFDSTGATLTYESEDMATAALMDAEFRELNGMDEDDAAVFGLILEEITPPEGESDDGLSCWHESAK
jgi:hypothetical protein